MIDLLFIAGDPEIARYAAQSGATRLFVDLEIVGKRERQGHLNTVISEHRIEDVARVKGARRDVRRKLAAGSKSSSQSVVWMTLPSKSWIPGMSGVCGWDRNPVAVIRYWALRVLPSARLTCQRLVSSSHRALSTETLKRMWRRTSYLLATSTAYFLISGPGVNIRDQSGFGSKKYEYVVVGTSTARPG